MSVTLTPRFRPFKKVLIGVAILAGLISAIFVATRLVLDSLFMDIATQGATGLAAGPFARVSLPAYQSTDGLLQVGGINVVRAVSLSLETANFEIAESRLMEITEQSGGFLDEFKVHRQSKTSPWLEARLRLRADTLDSVLTELRSLGNIHQETESSETLTRRKSP